MIIPKAIREALDIRSGTDLNVELDSDMGFRVTVAPTDRLASVRRLAGSLAHRAKPMTRKQEAAALLAMAGTDDERTKPAGRRR